MQCDTTTWLQNRITATQTQIEAYENAIAALLSDGVQSYSLNTGQTTQNVTKFDLPSLESTLDALYNRYTVLCNRLNGGGTFNVKPYW